MNNRCESQSIQSHPLREASNADEICLLFFLSERSKMDWKALVRRLVYDKIVCRRKAFKESLK